MFILTLLATAFAVPGAPAPVPVVVVPPVVAAPAGAAAAPTPVVAATTTTTTTVVAPPAPTPTAPAAKDCGKLAMGYSSLVSNWSKGQGETKCAANGSDMTVAAFANAGWMTLEDVTHTSKKGVPHWHCAEVGGALLVEDMKTHTCQVTDVAAKGNAEVRQGRLAAELRKQGDEIDGLTTVTAANTADITELKAQVKILQGGQASLETDLDIVAGNVTTIDANVSAVAQKAADDNVTLTGALVLMAQGVSATNTQVAAVKADLSETKATVAATQKEVRLAPAVYANFGVGYAGSMGMDGFALNGELGLEIPWVRVGANGFAAFGGNNTLYGGTVGVYLASWDNIPVGKGGARYGFGPVVGYEQYVLGGRDQDALAEALGYGVKMGVGGFVNVHSDSHVGAEFGLDVTSDTGVEVDTSDGTPSRMPDTNGMGGNVRLTVHFGGK